MAIGQSEARHTATTTATPAPSLPLLLAAFAAFGAMFGAWQVLLADLSAALGLSPGPLGLALAVGFALSIPALASGGRLVERRGLRATVVAAGAGMGLAVASAAALGRAWQLFLLLPLLYACTGIYDVAINAAAVRFEAATGRRVLPLGHAAFSGGGAAGALATGLLVSAGVPFRAIYVGAALVIALVQGWTGLGTLPPAAPAAPADSADSARLLRNPVLLLLAVVTTLAFLSEGTMENWSAIYLRASLDLPALLGASGVAIFHLAMTIGRVGTAAALRVVRRLTLIRAAGVLAAVGMALALATTAPPLILGGILLVGLAFSGVVPVPSR